MLTKIMKLYFNSNDSIFTAINGAKETVRGPGAGNVEGGGDKVQQGFS